VRGNVNRALNNTAASPDGQDPKGDGQSPEGPHGSSLQEVPKLDQDRGECWWPFLFFKMILSLPVNIVCKFGTKALKISYMLLHFYFENCPRGLFKVRALT
jgi:hypothetical protein